MSPFLNPKSVEQLVLPLLSWAIDFCPWYSKKTYIEAFDRIKRNPAAVGDVWFGLPIVAKTDLRGDGPSFYATETPAQHGPISQVSTSGSTGIPVVIKKTAGFMHIHDQHTLREHAWRQRDFSKKHGFIRYLEQFAHLDQGIDLPNWGPPVANQYETGPASTIHLGQSVENIARWLEKTNPDYLSATPSVIDALLDRVDPAKIPNLRDIKMYAEPLEGDLIARVRNAWGASCSDLYSTTEVGTIAFCCPEADALHIQEDEILVEILREDGSPCEVGEIGRVVLTAFFNYAMPLIRFDVGDYAQLGAPCSCGRPGRVLSKVMGRQRNMFKTPDGRRFWPVEMCVLRDIEPVQQVQLLQTSLQEVQLNVVLSRDLSADEERQIIQKTQETLTYPFHIKITPQKTIPRGAGGKFEECICLV